MTKIEWTDKTWNPIVGCSVVSPGCKHCYAMKFAGARLDGNPNVPHYAGLTEKSKAGSVWTGKVAQATRKTLMAPIGWRQRAMVFVNSMGDLFHEDVPDAWIDEVFAVMGIACPHTFQVLTKRSERMRDYVSELRAGRWLTLRWPDDGTLIFDPMCAQFDDCFSHVWLGVSVEDQRRADERIPHLLATPAAVRFLSCEPLLGPVNLECTPWPNGWERPVDDLSDGVDPLRYVGTQGKAVDWVIVGGESGPGARPMHPDWVRSLRDQCNEAGVPFFFKQWGEWVGGRLDMGEFYADEDAYGPDVAWNRGGYSTIRCKSAAQAGLTGYDDWGRVGKKHAGRLLDGREWNEMPEQIDLEDAA